MSQPRAQRVTTSVFAFREHCSKPTRQDLGPNSKMKSSQVKFLFTAWCEFEVHLHPNRTLDPQVSILVRRTGNEIISRVFHAGSVTCCVCVQVTGRRAAERETAQKNPIDIFKLNSLSTSDFQKNVVDISKSTKSLGWIQCGAGRA